MHSLDVWHKSKSIKKCLAKVCYLQNDFIFISNNMALKSINDSMYPNVGEGLIKVPETSVKPSKA